MNPSEFMDRQEINGRRLIPIFLILILVSLATVMVIHENSSERRYQNIYENGEKPNWSLESIKEIEKYANKTKDPNVMVEVTKYPNQEPTESQVKEAWKFYNQSFENAKDEGWFSKDKGLNSGYFNWKGDLFHYPHENYTNQDNGLNPQEPEFLMYYPDPNNDSREILAGVMFQTNTLEDHGKQIGGPITTWHYHYHDPKICLDYWGPVSNVEIETDDGEKCPEDTKIKDRTYEMLHVWFVEHPRSQFASEMFLEKEIVADGPEKLSYDEFRSKHTE